MKPLVIWMWLAVSADATSSCHAIKQGFVEANPLLPNNCKGIVAAKIASASMMTYLAMRQKDKLSKFGVGIVATSNSVAFSWNVYQIKRR